MLKLMLDKEKPDADRRGDERYRQLDQKEGNQPHQPDAKAGEKKKRRIGGHCTCPRSKAHMDRLEGPAVPDKELIGRPENKQCNGMPVDPIAQTTEK